MLMEERLRLTANRDIGGRSPLTDRSDNLILGREKLGSKSQARVASHKAEILLAGISEAVR